MSHVSPLPIRRGIALTLAIVGLCGAGVAGGGSPFGAEQLADGVHLLIPREPSSELTNSLVVEQQSGLLVVEAQPTVAAGEQLVRAIEELSDKPIRYLILSHAHTESIGGASAFPAATVLIARRQVRDALQDPRFRPGAELLVDRGDAKAWKAPPLRMPDLLIGAPVDVDDPERHVKLLTPAHSHTDGDMFVHLPEQRILYMGSVLGERGTPYAADGNITGWLATLNHVTTMNPAVVVPLRGPTGDLRLVRRLRDGFAWLRGQVELAYMNSVAPGKIPDRVLRSAGLDDYYDRSFKPSFLRGTIEQIVEEAEENRRKRGIH